MNATEAKRWEDRIMPHLEGLAAKMLKNRDFGYLSTVADLMAGLIGPGWSRLADEDRLRYLEQMKIDFHPRGMGDSVYAEDPDYSAVLGLIDFEFRAVKRRL